MGRNRLGKLKTKSVKITIPEYIVDFLKDNNINISGLVTDLLLKYLKEKNIDLDKYKE